MSADITKTWKLFIAGGYPRSESGRVFPIVDARARAAGRVVAYAAQASRKDLRDAVEAARSAQHKWASSSGYLRGQIVYRLAEILEGRRLELIEAIRMGGRIGKGDARREVNHAIDMTVSFAGWTDKLESVIGGRNSVAGPFHCFSQVEPCGVVAVVAPQSAPLLGFLCLTLPAIAVGNAVVVLASEHEPVPALLVAEAAPSADIPAGVLNVLTGKCDELISGIASHRDIDSVVASVGDEHRKTLQLAVAENFKRVRVIDPAFDFSKRESVVTPRAFDSVIETKTVWHTIGV